MDDYFKGPNLEELNKQRILNQQKTEDRHKRAIKATEASRPPKLGPKSVGDIFSNPKGVAKRVAIDIFLPWLGLYGWFRTLFKGGAMKASTYSRIFPLLNNCCLQSCVISIIIFFVVIMIIFYNASLWDIVKALFTGALEIIKALF